MDLSLRLTEPRGIEGRGRDCLSRASVFSVWVEKDAATPIRDTLPSAECSLTCAISFLSGVSSSWSWYEVLCHLAHLETVRVMRNVVRMAALELTEGVAV